MSEEIIDAGNTSGTGERPTFLTVLCILSFIGAGISIVLLLMVTVLAGAATGAVGATSGVGMMWTYILLAIAMVAVSLIGVIKMWKLQKQGFYLYTGAAIAGIIIDVSLSGTDFNIVSVLITAAFIAMYGANLKHMK